MYLQVAIRSLRCRWFIAIQWSITSHSFISFQFAWQKPFFSHCLVGILKGVSFHCPLTPSLRCRWIMVYCHSMEHNQPQFYLLSVCLTETFFLSLSGWYPQGCFISLSPHTKGTKCYWFIGFLFCPLTMWSM